MAMDGEQWETGKSKKGEGIREMNVERKQGAEGRGKNRGKKGLSVGLSSNSKQVTYLSYMQKMQV